VEYLLKEKNLNPNLGDYDHRIALHVASGDGKIEVVKMLLPYSSKPPSTWLTAGERHPSTEQRDKGKRM
jgi:ankyrin repeat protein